MLRSSSSGMQQVTADALYAAKNTTVKLVPTTGQTVVFANNSIDQTTYLAPAGPLATLTVTIPSEATSRIGQRITLCTSQNIVALTFNGATTIMNTITSLTASDCFTFQKIDANTWIHA